MQNKITYLFLFLSVNLFAQSSWVNYANDHNIYDLAIENDQLWVGTQGGLIQIDIQTGEKEIYQAWNSGLRGTGIKEVEIAANGMKWLGGENAGLFSFDGNNWEHYYEINTGDTLVEVVDLQLDLNDNPWFISNINDNCVGCKKLISYNGSEFINHSNFLIIEPSLERMVDFAFIDTVEMWIAYRKGIVKYNGAEVIEILDASTSPINPDESIDQIEIDRQGNLWLTCSTKISGTFTYTYRILKYDGLNWSIEDADAPGFARNFFQDQEGNLWFEFYSSNTQERSYASYDGSNWSRWAVADIPTLPPTSSGPSKPLLYEVDSEGDWWMVSYSGIHEQKVFKVSDTSFTGYDTQVFPLSWNYNVNLGVDCDNNIWTGTNRFDGTNWESFDYAQTGFSGSVWEMAVDPTTCDLWFALYSNSSSADYIGKYNGTDFETISFSLGNNGSAVGVDISQDGIVYVATTQEGLARNINGNWTFFNEGNSPLTDFVTAVTITSDGTVWASTFGNGIARLVGSTWTVFDSSNSPVLDYTYHIDVDKEENIWVRSETGLAKYDGTDWEVFPFDIGRFGVNSITEDHLGNYWLSTQYGALYWDGFDYSVFNINNSNIGSNSNRAIHIDPINGNIWFLHGTGLSVLKRFHVGNNISGLSFFDANQDGIFDYSEDVRLPGQNILLLPDSTTAVTNSIGGYSFFPEDTGAYQVVYEPSLPYVQISPSTIDTFFSEAPIEGINFAVWSENIPEGLSIDIVNGSLVCNNGANIWVTFKNEGFLNVSGEIMLTFPPEFTYEDAHPEVTTLEPSQVTWLFEDLGFMESRTYQLVLNGPDVDALNQDFDFIAEMVVDGNSTSQKVSDEVLCSYDPNDKTAFPTGESFLNYSLLNDPIQYTIRFQNMGNYRAQDIVITDLMDPSLDLSTFEVIASSHEMTTTIDAERQIVFRFNDINLPPEEQDFLGSQGFIKYQISPKQGLTDPTIIQNSANIYFDLNPAIVTNTTENILVETLPTVSTKHQEQTFKALIYPNPSSSEIWIEWPNDSEPKDWHVEVYDIFGKLWQQQNATLLKQRISISETGFYILKIQKDDYYQIEKIVVQ